jgi:hypothetical protein
VSQRLYRNTTNKLTAICALVDYLERSIAGSSVAYEAISKLYRLDSMALYSFNSGFALILINYPKPKIFCGGIPNRAYCILSEKDDVKSMRRAVKVKDLPDGWKHHFFEQIKLAEKIEARNTNE